MTISRELKTFYLRKREEVKIKLELSNSSKEALDTSMVFFAGFLNLFFSAWIIFELFHSDYFYGYLLLLIVYSPLLWNGANGGFHYSKERANGKIPSDDDVKSIFPVDSKIGIVLNFLTGITGVFLGIVLFWVSYSIFKVPKKMFNFIIQIPSQMVLKNKHFLDSNPALAAQMEKSHLESKLTQSEVLQSSQKRL